eukprot:SAG22_NODE_2757_length_2240_cov_2.347034_2_plen_137_part_00
MVPLSFYLRPCLSMRFCSPDTWVNGSESAYQEKREAAGGPKAVGGARDRDNGELRFSIRSLQKFLPWWNGALPACLAAWLPGCLAAWLPGCLAAWLPACLAAWLPACLPGCLPACLPGTDCNNLGQHQLLPLHLAR